MTQSRRYLEEIVRHTRRIALRDWVLPLAGLGVELQEGVLEVIVDLHDRRLRYREFHAVCFSQGFGPFGFVEASFVFLFSPVIV